MRGWDIPESDDDLGVLDLPHLREDELVEVGEFPSLDDESVETGDFHFPSLGTVLLAADSPIEIVDIETENSTTKKMMSLLTRYGKRPKLYRYSQRRLKKWLSNDQAKTRAVEALAFMDEYVPLHSRVMSGNIAAKIKQADQDEWTGEDISARIKHMRANVAAIRRDSPSSNVHARMFTRMIQLLTNILGRVSSSSSGGSLLDVSEAKRALRKAGERARVSRLYWAKKPVSSADRAKNIAIRDKQAADIRAIRSSLKAAERSTDRAAMRRILSDVKKITS